MNKNISLLKEHGKKEFRVAILPQKLEGILKLGYTVLVETGIGKGIGIKDSEYKKNGALIVSRSKAWKSGILIKYKPPTEYEYNFLKKGQIICSVFHAEGNIEGYVVKKADLIIGTVLISTYNTPSIIDEKLLKKIKKGSVIIDFTCGYGEGYMPTFSSFNTFSNTISIRHGTIHSKIDIMSSSFLVTSS